MGPYVATGLRTEQVAVYVAAVTLVLVRSLRFSLASRVGVLGVITTSLLLITILSLLAFFTSPAPLPSSFAVVATLDNLLLAAAIPAIVAMVGASLRASDYGVRLLETVLKTLIVVLCVNSLLAVAQVAGIAPQFTEVFLPRSGDGMNVAERARMANRFSGVFNQPAEAGLAYAVGLMSWIFLHRSGLVSGALAGLSGALLVIGGLMPVSKTFILGGLPLAILYYGATLLQTKNLRGTAWYLVALGALTGIAVLVGRLAEMWWTGAARVGRLITPASHNEGLIRLYTAGRFGGSDGTVGQYAGQVAEANVLVGIGVGHGLTVDNAYLEIFALSGAFGLAAYGVMLMALLVAAARVKDPGLRMFVGALLVVIVGAGLGAPVLTLNRAGTQLLVVLSVAVLTASRSVGSPALRDRKVSPVSR
jgi:hypothetical protein